LVPIGVATAAILAVAAGAAVFLAIGALAVFKPDNVGDDLEVVKIALAITGEIGGVVALVVAYRRQRLAEAAEEHGRQRRGASLLARDTEGMTSAVTVDGKPLARCARGAVGR
jgi:hypothetical protein